MAKKKKVSKKIVVDRDTMIETIAGIYTDEAEELIEIGRDYHLNGEE